MRLYSTLSRRLEELPPPPGPIRMYFCGPTVYQRIHVGNARPFVISMWLRRWLRERGYEVTLVENITDINDKIYEAAPGASAALAADASQWYVEDTSLLGLGRPDVEPTATESVPAIVDAIAELVSRGFAYEVEGDVYFRVARDPSYGQLSRQRPDQVEEQEPNPRKEDPRDFALWKGTKPGEDTSWESPWGAGRPGWHIECSVMASEYLGPVFEIHGGGLDLVFPHHENELAQSRALGHEFARIWTHNGMLQMVGEKMSKSLGNIITLRDALERWGPETILLFFMTAHWRSPIDLSDATLEAARAQLESLRNAFRQEAIEAPPGEWPKLVDALEDDFNTPAALEIFHGWARNGYLDLLELGLALFGIKPARITIEFGTAKETDAALPITPVKVQFLGSRPPEAAFALSARRHEARKAGDYAAADRLREELAVLGYKVDDLPDGYVIVGLDRERHPER